ncbi:MAG: CocE/NonD family hydrolase, partial [Planctomycetia bacterium]|nr:CocE/NonD family hydrolase [Planctomycetia bacterium]
LLIGPWLHGSTNKSGVKIGDLTYPENASFAMDEHMLRWFDHYLKGADNGIERESPVRYYVMGALGEQDAPGNKWRSARDFPPPAVESGYYFHSGGKLSTAPSSVAAAPTTFRSDPARPAPIVGTAFPGARDAAAYEAHPDVRTFSTSLLTAPVEWTGLVKAEIFVSSTAPDADFIVRVSDVYPDGRSILLIDGVRRARYREGFEKEVPLPAGQPVKLSFEIGWLSQIFNRGHRIRVTIGSTGADFYEVNPQTGGVFTIDPSKTTVVAENGIYHDRQRVSRIIAPVVREIASE